jgi:hypothetical protein
VRFGRSTIEHWLYAARSEPNDPIRALARKLHAQAGSHPSVGAALREAIIAQHRAHPRWSFKLHHDNLVAQSRTQPEIGKVPSVTVLRRFMKGLGLIKHKGPRHRRPMNGASDADVFQARERRSFEVGHVHALWHSDFHDYRSGKVGRGVLGLGNARSVMGRKVPCKQAGDRTGHRHHSCRKVGSFRSLMNSSPLRIDKAIRV